MKLTDYKRIFRNITGVLGRNADVVPSKLSYAPIMIVRYDHTDFEFEPRESGKLAGRLKLNGRQQKLLTALVESEKEDWYLNSNGERLVPDELFSLSPWSIETRKGRVKLLNRLLNIHTGEALFSTPDTYGGELFSYLRGS